MNKKDRGSKASYISVVIVMLVAVLVIFGLLEMAKADKKAKPINSGAAATTTNSNQDSDSINSDDVDVTDNNENIDSQGDKIVNFTEPLSTIIDGHGFFGDYKVTIKYNGVIFNFNCTIYDPTTEKCATGSALMTIDKYLIPLYTYSHETENYLNRADDLYIILDDKYVVVTINKVGESAGDAKIYNRSDGLLIGTLNNVLTGYRYKESMYAKLYPNITDNSFNYYMCDNNAVKIAYVDLNAIDSIGIDEVIEEASCY